MYALLDAEEIGLKLWSGEFALKLLDTFEMDVSLCYSRSTEI